MALLQAILSGDLSAADRLAGPVFAEMTQARLSGDADRAAMDEALLARLPCRHPIRRVWQDEDGRTGEASLRCGSRSVLACPSCARLYEGDVRAVIYDGLHARLAAGERLVMLTLTAPSFGQCHLVPKPGRPRRRCRCGATHSPGDALSGIPLELDSWDYAGAVAWNAGAPRLFTRTTDALSDWLSATTGAASERLSYARIAEWQQRGLVHFHVIIALPRSVTDEDLGLASAAVSGRPWLGPSSSRAVAIETVCHAVTSVDPSTGASLSWGRQIRADVLGSEAAAFRSAGYVAKAVSYLMKDIVDGGSRGESAARKAHVSRLAAAADQLRCGRPSRSGRVTAESQRFDRCKHAHSMYGDRRGCRGRAHKQAGFRGRVFTCSRSWGGLSMTVCRARRRDFRAARSGRVASDLSWSWPSRRHDHTRAAQVRRDVAAVAAAEESAALALLAVALGAAPV